MSEQFDGLRVARERIAKEAEQRTGFLDLGRLGLTELPPELYSLHHLRHLNLGNRIADEEGEWRTAAVDGPGNQIDGELDRIGELANLEELSVSGTNVQSFSSLTQLEHLLRLDCSATPVTDLTQLTALATLQMLDCSITLMTDLTPVAALTALQTLYCWGTRVADLTPLAALPELQKLACWGTPVTDLTPLAALTALQTLNCSRTPVADLTPLAALAALQTLNCSHTRVADLTPLAALPALQTLNCASTRVTDLTPLAKLRTLQMLYCWNTHVTDLTPLAALTALQTLNCSRTPVADLTPLAKLGALQTLNCAYTQVADLTPLAAVAALEGLSCRATRVADLTPLAALAALRALDCADTPVAELAPLARLAALQTLYCAATQVADLTPLAGLAALHMVNCMGCRLTRTPSDFWQKASLRVVMLGDTYLPGVPSEVFARSDDQLGALRAHFNALASGKDPVTDVKLFVLGNGKSGKTQICRRLRGESFQEIWDSTHGALVTSADLPTSGEGAPVKLHIWDFGGQDIYHGTHALFLRSRAMFLLVWSRETENTDGYEHSGIRFRNNLLPYWVEYVRHLGEADAAALIVQSKCDRTQDEARRFPVTPETLEALGYCRELHYSAANDRGRPSLVDALQDAIKWLRTRNGDVEELLGAGWMRVQRLLEKMRDTDAALPPVQRRHRTLSQDEFRSICEKGDDVSASGREHLLGYLHNSGVVFHHKGLFNDQIILDQTWALDAIYAVFNRDKCYRQLRLSGGRFTRSLLELLVWEQYTVEEQELFLSTMQSCGICFIHRRGTDRDDDETQYIAPDLLPERQAVQDDLDEKWQLDQPTEVTTFEYPFLHPGLARDVISRIGILAGINALYWRGGLCVYEKTTRSHALIEQEMAGDWHGRIQLKTQGGQAALLLERLAQEIEKEQERLGLRADRVNRIPSAHGSKGLGPAGREQANDEPVRKLDFGQLRTAPQWYVSYAWGDASPEGRARKEVVDFICAEAERQGTPVKRDKSALHLGDSILRFMQELGQGDRVFVVLSDKYLKSRNCMYELFEVWRHSRGDKEAFRRRIRVFALPDAKISDGDDRIRCALYWQEQYAKREALLKENLRVAGEADFREFDLMRRFHSGVSDVLAAIADVLLPRTLEELKKYGFNDVT